MKKKCLRCNNCFECLHNNMKDCWCTAITLDNQQLKYVADNYTDCMCNSCLQEIKKGFYTIAINPVYAKNKQSFFK